jgi:hypothetical protein
MIAPRIEDLDPIRHDLMIVARAHQKGRSVPGGPDAASADGRRGQGMGTDTRDWPD